MAAEAEGVVDDGVHRHLARGVWHIIEVTFGIGSLQIDGRRHDAVLDGQGARGHLHRTGRAQHVAGCAFGGTDDELARMVAKNRLYRLRFADVTLRCGGTVGVDVGDVGQIQATGTQSHFHAARRAFTAG